MFTFDDIINQSSGAKIVSESHDRSYGHNPADPNECANLAVSNGKIALAFVGELPWHKQGVRVDQAMTSAEALKYGNLADWQLRKVQQWIDWNGQQLETGSYAIVRTDCDPPEVFGTVGERYTILENELCFDFMDSLGDDVRYETVGALGNGSTVWMLTDIPGSKFEATSGDECQTKMLLSTTHDGSGAVRVLATSVRVVCQNTHRLAMQGNKVLSLRHTQSVKARMKQAQIAMERTVEASKQYAENAKQLASVELEPIPYFDGCLDEILKTTIAGQAVTKRTVDDRTVLNAIMDVHDSADRIKEERRMERYKKRRGGLLADILERYETERCPGSSAWSAFNAVTESVDHGEVLRFKGKERERADNRFNSLTNGRGAEIKEMAFDAAMEMAS